MFNPTFHLSRKGRWAGNGLTNPVYMGKLHKIPRVWGLQSVHTGEHVQHGERDAPNSAGTEAPALGTPLELVLCISPYGHSLDPLSHPLPKQ